jgi:alkaline phosphatase D
MNAPACDTGKVVRVAAACVGLLFCGPRTQAASLTHGPLVGHTTDSTSRIWVRADRACEARVRVTAGGSNRRFVSDPFSLTEEGNYCGSVRVEGLSPATKYTYAVLLDRQEQPCSVPQTFTTYPRPGASCTVRIGFGHSLRGRGEQTIWRAVADKKPHLFILMGDNIYADSTEPGRQRAMYLAFRADPHFRTLAATTPIYAVWDDHDYGRNNSDRTQPGKERSLKTFRELWANPPVHTPGAPGIWTRFRIGPAEFFLMDVRYHRSPNDEPDGPGKTMLGTMQTTWLKESLAASAARFKFPVSGSSWNCGGPEAWNHAFTRAYDDLVSHLAAKRVRGVILLGGDQHACKIAVRPGESWNGYDLHEWMAGQLWNHQRDRERGYTRGFGLITLDTTARPATARLAFFDEEGHPRQGRRILYTERGALRALLDSPAGATGVAPENRKYIDRLRPVTSGPLWDAMPPATGEVLSEHDLDWPDTVPYNRR